MKKEDIKVTWFVILIMIQIITVICVLRGLELKCNQDNIISHKEGFPMYVHGLAIDSEENTYIGVVGKINVYNKEGKFIRSYSLGIHQSFVFRIDENENLIIAIGRESTELICRLDGTIISDKILDYTDDREVKVIKRNSKTYTLSNKFYFTTVKCEDEKGNSRTLYRVPIYITIFRLIQAISFTILLALFIRLCIKKTRGFKYFYRYKYW